MQSAKRVNIVSLKLVREGSVLYRERRVQSPEDAYRLAACPSRPEACQRLIETESH
ncbi:hypothetical protein GGR02_003528 [Anoxybacillus voinovskiensis]|uniref:Uncharacterized protein n=1 Tax=Anoxybacteroides voinovskiense TaxID=230470 RepID=A0A840DRH3_9BACL|nr:hypothetical protein [Anoxybacillus voinovskiensis]GGJ81263.1 hypothetical protein GCM10008982_33420 [Anoxybacillus voinovskiensis]